MDKSDIAKRMKEYEHNHRHYLERKVPVILRLDGRAFHSFTKGFQRPFDEVLVASMQDTMKYLCENIQGCVIGYTQSDEITLVLVDYNTPETSAWFDNCQNKIESIAASMATIFFNKHFKDKVNNFHDTKFPIDYMGYCIGDITTAVADSNQLSVYLRAMEKGAMFDCRAFNIPKEDVTNNIYWRQLDAMRNSVQMVGQANFSHKELQNKSCNDIKEMLIGKGISWNNLPTHLKRGSCCIKTKYRVDGVERSKWEVDLNIPIFKGDGRDYIDKLVFVGTE